MPGLALAQAECGFPVFYPAGATCSGGPADGRPCYVFDAGDNFGCPGGTCIDSPGGGRATYYQAATGACGIPVSNPQPMVTAVAEYLWDGSAACGRCARVTGPPGTIVVEITDLCPAGPNPVWCAGDAAHLDLSEAAFAAVADPPRGVAYIEWEIVECPVSANASLLNVDGANSWWYAVFALETRQGVSGLEVRDSSTGASWLQGVRQTWNAFVVHPGYQMTLPYDVRLTGITGEVITTTDVVTDLNGQSLFDMAAQFEPFNSHSFAGSGVPMGLKQSSAEADHCTYDATSGQKVTEFAEGYSMSRDPWTWSSQLLAPGGYRERRSSPPDFEFCGRIT